MPRILVCDHSNTRVLWQAMEIWDVTSNECLDCGEVWLTPFEI